MERLRDLERGSIPDGISVAQLFSVRLDDLTEVSRRRDELRAEIRELDARVAQLERERDTPEPQPPTPGGDRAASATGDLLRATPPGSVPTAAGDPTGGATAPSSDAELSTPEAAASPSSSPTPTGGSDRAQADAVETEVTPPATASEAASASPPQAAQPAQPQGESPAAREAIAEEAERTARERGEALRREAERRAQEARTQAYREARETWQAQTASARSELRTLELRRTISRLRLGFLERLASRLDSMPSAARGVLRSLDEPRNALREHAVELRDLAAAATDVSTQLDLLGASARRGALVGFMSDRRYLAERLPALAASLRQRASELAARTDALLELARASEAEGRSLRRMLWLSTASAERSPEIDSLFLVHLRTQRSLRASLRETPDASSDTAATRALARDLRELLPSAYRIGTADEAETVADAATSAIERLDQRLDDAVNQPASWQLAFENDVVALLSTLSSREARQLGYAWSRELIEDAHAELGRALRGARAWQAERLRALESLPRDLLSPATGGALLGFLQLVLLWTGWSVLRRRNARLVTGAVRRLCRLPSMQGQFGRAVRWAGLVQAVLPTLLLFPVAEATLHLLGRDSIEARTIEAMGIPIYLYWLGRQTLLGLTRRVTRGRPALLPLNTETSERLRASYDRLGLGIVPVLVLERGLQTTIGAGRIAAISEAVVWVWAAGWLSIEAVNWRRSLASAWERIADPERMRGFEVACARWMRASQIGVLLTPVAAARVTLTRVARAATRSRLALRTLGRLRTRSLRRAVRKADEGASSEGSVPEDYRSRFPLYPLLGDEGAVIIRREEVAQQALDRLKSWRSERSEGSLVISGEKGIGKTTLANLIARRLASDLAVTQLTLSGKPLRPKELLAQLCPALELPMCDDVETLAQALRDGPERVVFIDEAHNVFLRLVDGYHAYDALVKLVGATSKHVFWVLLFNSFTWQFLQASRARVHSLRAPLEIPRWRTSELQQLLLERHGATGYALEFDEILLTEERGAGHGIELVAEADGYFRLLSDLSGGNPRVATRLWLSSLRSPSERSVQVGLFRDASEKRVRELSDELLFALAAICQHENLSSAELTRVLNLSEDFSRYAMRVLGEHRLIEPKSDAADRFALASTAYPTILRTLRSKHLIFE